MLFLLLKTDYLVKFRGLLPISKMQGKIEIEHSFHYVW